MAVRFGVHAGPQRVSIGELTAVWHMVDQGPFDWCSVWDHFYVAEPGGGYDCFEAVALHAALATATERVRCGCLVYSVGYRHPAVLANAIATIDHLSNGRAVLALGAGWFEQEYRAYGIDFPSGPVRLRMLDEALTCVRGLLHDSAGTDFDGEFFHLRDAHLEPRPIQPHLPVWVGGGGEKVTLRIAARHADGWNTAFTAPIDYRRKHQLLAQYCADVDRDVEAIECSANVPFAADESALGQQFGALAEFVAPAAVTGSTQQMVDRVGEFLAAGAQTVILALRPPFDLGALERFATDVVPAFSEGNER